MKLAVLSLFKNAKRFYQKLYYSRTDYQIVCFVEEESNWWGTYYDGIETVSIGKAMEYYSSCQVDKFLIVSLEERFNKKMYEILKDLQVNDDDILYADLEDINLWSSDRVLYSYNKRKEYDTIEFHVADHCNLNCKYCSMFSGLVDEEKYPSVTQYEKDMQQIKKCFRSVKRIKLLGGEPLLNPELDTFIKVTHDIYPFAQILVISNGLAIKGMDQKLIDCMRENNVELVVSYYKILGKKADEIHAFLKKHEIRHRITPCITSFYKMYDLSGNQNKNENFQVCNCKEGCTTLRDGKLMSCFVPSIIHIADERFHLDIVNQDYVDLYQPELSSEIIRNAMKKPLEVCKYCLIRGIQTEWEIMDKNIYDNIKDWSV